MKLFIYSSTRKQRWMPWVKAVIKKLEDRQRVWLGKEEDGSDRHEFYDELEVVPTVTN